jgi:hypothetical protein
MIHAIENFISKEEADILLRYCRLAAAKNYWKYNDRENDYWKDRCIDARSLIEKPEDFGGESAEIVRDIMLDIKDRISRYISEISQTNDTYYTDCLQLVRWPIGSSQDPHADAEYDDHSDHPSPWREYGSIIYLNDNYTGGNTYFVNKRESMQPKSGLLAVFPGTLEYTHGVSEVGENIRYTIASFWTRQEQHNMYP